MTEIADTPGRSVRDAPIKDYLVCPEDHSVLRHESGRLICQTCGLEGRLINSVVSFLAAADKFYEGKYNNQTKYMPANDGFWATLPLRVVLQGYPTAVSAAVPPRSRVIEIGCAGGIAWLGRRYEMIGLDLSESALHLASKIYSRVIQCDATKMPIRDASVDAVISSCLFEHLSPSGKSELLRECHRVLRPNGKVVFFYDIQTENPVIRRYRDRRPDLYQSLFLDGDGHIGYTGIEENRKHFIDSGFRIVREVFHERTPVLANSAWQKLAMWPGHFGRLGRAGRSMTSGLGRLPSLAAISVVDASAGRLFPRRYARGMTTTAIKR